MLIKNKFAYHWKRENTEENPLTFCCSFVLAVFDNQVLGNLTSVMPAWSLWIDFFNCPEAYTVPCSSREGL